MNVGTNEPAPANTAASTIVRTEKLETMEPVPEKAAASTMSRTEKLEIKEPEPENPMLGNSSSISVAKNEPAPAKEAISVDS